MSPGPKDPNVGWLSAGQEPLGRLSLAAPGHAFPSSSISSSSSFLKRTKKTKARLVARPALSLQPSRPRWLSVLDLSLSPALDRFVLCPDSQTARVWPRTTSRRFADSPGSDSQFLVAYRFAKNISAL